MFPDPRHLRQHADTVARCMGQLKGVFREMDQHYADVAGRYGFRCSGCEDNCCLTRFYHHTLLELLLLWEGFSRLPPAHRERISDIARHVSRESERIAALGESPRIMCPLNEAGLCILYDARPMICRLHGIPHELKTPGRGVSRGPGCGAFEARCGQLPYLTFDRTPFYAKMAQLERQLQQAVAGPGKTRMTVAAMIVAFGNRCWSSLP